MGDTTPKQQSYEEFLNSVYSATTPAESRALYEKWAARYDTDLENEGYASPSITADAIVKHLDRRPVTLKRMNGKLKVLDAGCGTGMVGVCLRKQAKKEVEGLELELNVDGCDLSAGMLEQARKTGAYLDLKEVDLSKKLDVEEESYDVVSCVGTLTKGHVGPGVLKEFVRVVKRGWGLVAVTVIDEIWESGGYKAVMDEEEKYGRVEIKVNELFDVWKGDSASGRLVVLRRKFLAEEIAHAGIGA